MVNLDDRIEKEKKDKAILGKVRIIAQVLGRELQVYDGQSAYVYNDAPLLINYSYWVSGIRIFGGVASKEIATVSWGDNLSRVYDYNEDMQGRPVIRHFRSGEWERRIDKLFEKAKRLRGNDTAR